MHPILSGSLLGKISSALGPLGLTHSRAMLRGALFVRSDGVAVAVDHHITDSRYPFPYSEYTEEQNDLMSAQQALYRVTVDDEQELILAEQTLTNLLNRAYENDDRAPAPAGNRELWAIDPTAPDLRRLPITLDRPGLLAPNQAVVRSPVEGHGADPAIAVQAEGSSSARASRSRIGGG